jgi:hypothetical protein
MFEILSVNLFSQKHPSFPKGGLRHMIFSAGSNGLGKSGAIIRLGGKVLIDEARFFEWVKSGAAK